MKLVQLLAKELKEWPEGVTHLTQSEVGNEIYNALEGNSEGALDFLDHRFDTSSRHSERPYPIVSRDQWQAEREKMNKPKWIRHRGGNSTLHPGTMVEARLRSGEIQRAIAGAFLWDNSLSDHAVSIMAYRVIEEAKDQEIKEVKDTNLGTLTYKLEIDATEATKEIDSLVAKWGQIESPLKWRDEIIELEAYEEEFRREREKLIRKLESEGFKLIDYMAPVYGEQIIDMSDWRNWQAGDVIEIVANEGAHEFENGEEVIVAFLDIEDAEMNVKAEYKDGSDYWWLSGTDAKFIRRP